MFETGIVDCKCGDQIMSNSGKAMYKIPDMVVCWNPRCGRVYSYDAIEKARKENEVVVFESPGKDLKVFSMNDCDWWCDKSIDEAKKNYPAFIVSYPNECIDNPHELKIEELKEKEFYPDGDYLNPYSFFEELQRLQSISDDPSFFASTEF